MARATANHVLDILRNHSLELLQRLGLPVREAQLSVPVGGGPRIRVSIAKGTAVSVPTVIEFPLRKRSVQVPLEVAEDFQQYSPL